MDNKTKQIETLAAHALCTLPDSRTTSTQLLYAIIAALPKGHDTRLAAQMQLRLRDEADKAQEEFTLIYTLQPREN